MGDSEIVASIVAGGTDGLAKAYDRYADPLYKYCRFMLSDPAGAADATQDTFVIAASRLIGLRESERLRAWLYAVARNECLRILRARKTTVAPDAAPGVTADGADVSDNAERAELRRLLEDAAAGLNPSEREIIELQLRQGLEPAEVATVLGVSRNHAHALVSQAREQFQACLSALLVIRAGRADCGELAAMLADWDGRLTVPLRKRVHRHIEHCATCSTQRASELRPAILPGLSPGTALAAAAAESFRLAPGPPAGLKARTLALAIGQNSGANIYRAVVLGRAGAFGRHGFPKPVYGPKPGLPHHPGGRGGLRSSPRARTAVAASVLLAGAVVAVAFALIGNTGHVRVADGEPSATAAATPGSGIATAPAPGTSSAAVSTSAAAATPSLSRSRRPTQPAQAAFRIPSPTPLQPQPSTASPATTPPLSAPTPTHSPKPSPTSSRFPSPGTLVVNPPGGQIGPGSTQITLTAQGGAIDWSTTVSAGGGKLSVDPPSGTLAAGQTVTVTIQANHGAKGRRVTISPGGAVFTIVADRGAVFTIVADSGGQSTSQASWTASDRCRPR
jgi:RNA polymerase sigma factor (sigma-70 family)